MNEEKDILTNALRKRLEEYEIPVRKELWEKLEKELPGQSPAVRRKIIPVKWWSVAAMLALAFGTGIGIFFFNGQDARDIDMYPEYFVHISPKIPVKEAPSEIKIKEAEKVLIANVPTVPCTGTLKKITSKSIQTEQTNSEDTTKHEHLHAQNLQSQYTNPPENSTDTIKQESKPASKPEKYEKPVQPSLFKYNLAERSRSSKNNNLSFSLAMGNAAVMNEPNSGSGKRYIFTTDVALSPDNLSESEGLKAAEEMVNNFVDQLEKPTDIKYDFPVSLALSFKKQINQKWAIESGIIYTHLSTTEYYNIQQVQEQSNELMQVKKEYNMNYLGIPLKAVYSLYNNDPVSLYVSAGGMVEKAFYNQLKTYTGKETFNISELQWSLSGNIGISYAFSRRVGIFVEPGLTYHFNDGNEINTIRKDTPFNFNLNGGLRVVY